MTMLADPPAELAVAAPVTEHLLDDEAVLRFLVNGYHLVQTDFPPEFHAEVLAQVTEVMAEGNPGNEILERAPLLHQVYNDPAVRGALVSLLGPEYIMHAHRHCHATRPGTPGQGWHQDDVNTRHHQIWRVLGMYYPQEVTPEMGLTMILPGTQFRNAPTARMATYRTFKTELALNVPAGTVAITHYDIWHRAAPNRSNRTRYMLKFLFDRTAPPARPSWNADPARRAGMLPEFIRNWLFIDNQSDAYKHRVIWMNAWKWLWGPQEEEREDSIIEHYP